MKETTVHFKEFRTHWIQYLSILRADKKRINSAEVNVNYFCIESNYIVALSTENIMDEEIKEKITILGNF